MAQRRQERAEVEKTPADRWAFDRTHRLPSLPETMNQVNQSPRCPSDKWHAHEAVRNTAMMLQAGDRAFEAPNNIDVSSLGRQHHGQGRQPAFAVEARARHARAGQEMSDGIQTEILNDPKTFPDTRPKQPRRRRPRLTNKRPEKRRTEFRVAGTALLLWRSD